MEGSNFVIEKEHAEVEVEGQHSESLPTDYDKELNLLEEWITKQNMNENCTIRVDAVDDQDNMMKHMHRMKP